MATSASPAQTRRRNARGEGAKLREQLLEATVALLDAEGDLSRVTVRAIAGRAGVSPTALYLQFPDRDALVDAAIDRSFRAFNAAILTAASNEDEPGVRLRAMGRAYLDFAERQPAVYAVLFSTRRPTTRLAAASDDAGDQVGRADALATLGATVAAARPGLPAAEVRSLALMLWAALHGYATLRAARANHGWPSAAAYVDDVTRIHLGA